MKRYAPLPFLLAALLWAACANPGSPDGGPYDETPPHVTGSTPVYGKLGAKDTRIDIFFDELVQVENASEKVVVSPPQMNMPEIVSRGKYIRVRLQDSLKANTTYTIDFSDAITDNNEGNPLGNYAFVFSTSDSIIDTMEVAGTVLNAENLEPVKGILVGLHSDTTDAAFLNKPFDRVARTDGRGRFVIRGVAQGTYRVYALNDMDGDFRYSQKAEMLAFMESTVTTGSYPDVRMDTVWHDSIYYDSIVPVHYTHFTPDDIVLRAYTAKGQDRHLLKTERQTSEHLDAYFTAPSTELPQMEGLNFNAENAFAVDYNETKDTIVYWLRDTTLIYQDTLTAAFSYLENDSAGKLVRKTDTIDFISKFSHEKQVKWRNDEIKKWEKEQNKRKKKGLSYETEYPVPPLEVALKPTGSVAPNENLLFQVKEPLERIDTSKIHLYLQQDSAYVEVPYLLRPVGNSLMACRMLAEWRPLQQYRLVADSAAFTGIYTHCSKRMDVKFGIPSLDTYSSLFVHVKGVEDTMAVVQLLATDKPVASARTRKGTAEFYFVKPGNYYLRLFVDRNGNGKWDEGDFEKGTPPEETYYYPAKLNLRARWDVSQDWDIHALPLNRQKPAEITKQKPDKEKKIQNRNAERERNNRK